MTLLTPTHFFIVDSQLSIPNYKVTIKLTRFTRKWKGLFTDIMMKLVDVGGWELKPQRSPVLDYVIIDVWKCVYKFYILLTRSNSSSLCMVPISL